VSIDVIKKEFTDFDLFRDVLLGWDVDVTQLSAGPLNLQWQQVAFEDQLTLCQLTSNRRLADRMAIDHGRVTFNISFSPNHFCGVEIPAGTLLVVGPGREYRSVLPEGFQSFEMSAPIDCFRDIGLLAADPKFNDLCPENCIFNLTNHQLAEFRRLNQALSDFAAHGSDSSLLMMAAREGAINLVKSVVRQSEFAVGPDQHTRGASWLLALRAMEYIDRQDSSKDSIAAIGQELGCSTRALQIAFQSNLDMTPLQYLLARRLQLARRDLLAARPDNYNVTQIATEHEFFHFGRFSQNYRNLFGELPSETLKTVNSTRYRNR
jgi:AraC-like DNA-binding protein